MTKKLNKYPNGGSISSAEAKKRRTALFAPIADKIVSPAMDNLPLAAQSVISAYALAPGNIAPDDFGIRYNNPPPMDDVLLELQNKVKKMPQKNIDNLMKYDWKHTGMFGALGELRREGIGTIDALRYISHFKKLKGEGYTFKEGGAYDTSIIPVNTPRISQLAPQISDNAAPGIAPIHYDAVPDKKEQKPLGGFNYGSALLTAANIFNATLKDRDSQPIDMVNMGLSDNSMTPSYSDYKGYADPNSGRVMAAFGTEIAPELNSKVPQIESSDYFQIPPSISREAAPSAAPKTSESSSLDLDKKTSIYLTHQQGVAGFKAIQKAAALGVPVDQVYNGKANIRRNMEGNVGKDFYQKYGDLTASNFIDYWRGKMRSALSRAERKETPYDNVFKKVGAQTGFDPTYLKAISLIESSGNPLSNKDSSTQYKGLFQINRQELSKIGGNNLYDPYQNTYAAASIMADNRKKLQLKEGGEYDLSPEDLDYYRSQGYEFEDI